MLFLGIALAVALIVVPLTRGSFRRLADLDFEATGMLFVGLALQIGLEFLQLPEDRVDDLGFGLLLASYALVLGFCAANLRITGMTVVTVGIAMNALVIALNQGMPYKVPAGEQPETTVKHRPEQPGDVLTVLDDRIVLPAPFTAISFGDLVLAVGLVDVVYRGTRVPRRQRRVGNGHRQHLATVDALDGPDPLADEEHSLERVEDLAVVGVSRAGPQRLQRDG